MGFRRSGFPGVATWGPAAGEAERRGNRMKAHQHRGVPGAVPGAPRNSPPAVGRPGARRHGNMAAVKTVGRCASRHPYQACPDAKCGLEARA